jgi:hypothetical protein
MVLRAARIRHTVLKFKEKNDTLEGYKGDFPLDIEYK